MRDLDDPYAGLADLRDNNPVARFGDSEFYAVTSWDLIAEAVARTDDFSSNLTATMVWHDDGQVTGFPVAELGSSMHVLATADDPRHRMHRRIIMPSLTARRVSRLEPFIEQTLVDLWATGVVGDRVDWVESIAQRLPMAVVAELLGLPDYDIDELIRWSFASTVLLDGVVTADQLESATAAVGELSAYLTAAFDRALAEPGDDVLRDLARLVHCGDLDQDSAVMILIQLVAAGAESTVSLLGTSVWLLARHPDIVAALAADRELIPVFVEEVLRLESPFRGHYRHVVNDTTLGQTPLPAGSHLYLMWGAANRDPAIFDYADSISLDPSDRRSHMAFGKGIHLCVGAPLARLEARLGIAQLLDATSEFRLASPDPQWERSLMVRRLTTLPLILAG